MWQSASVPGPQPSVYHLPASHSIRPPFNYRAGHKPVFPHHTPSALRPSFNDEKSAPWRFGHLLCYYSPPFYSPAFFSFFPWMCVFVCLSHSTHSTDIWCPELQCLYSTPAVTASCVSGATSPRLSLLVTVKAESITESAQGEGEIQGQLHFL